MALIKLRPDRPPRATQLGPLSTPTLESADLVTLPGYSIRPFDEAISVTYYYYTINAISAALSRCCLPIYLSILSEYPWPGCQDVSRWASTFFSCRTIMYILTYVCWHVGSTFRCITYLTNVAEDSDFSRSNWDPSN